MGNKMQDCLFSTYATVLAGEGDVTPRQFLENVYCLFGRTPTRPTGVQVRMMEAFLLPSQRQNRPLPKEDEIPGPEHLQIGAMFAYLRSIAPELFVSPSRRKGVEWRIFISKASERKPYGLKEFDALFVKALDMVRENRRTIAQLQAME